MPLRCVSRQRILTEFVSLKHASPKGIYVSLSSDAATWFGVFFVRTGPYSPAVLRFQISFPPTYPEVPPVIIFITDVFHPLVTPLTTYTYTTSSSEADTVSASDEQRLPPGGFSLRHGFPSWVQQAAHVTQDVGYSQDGLDTLTRQDVHSQPLTKVAFADMAGSDTRQSRSQADASISEVLEYLRVTFSDEHVLDSLPLEAAGNSGAWHAWRSYRSAKTLRGNTSQASQQSGSGSTGLSGKLNLRSEHASESGARRPGEWNWDGVWEERVRKGIQSSLSEPVLYGNAGIGDDVIQFLDVDSAIIKEMAAQARS